MCYFEPLLSELGYADNSSDDDFKKCLKQETAGWSCTFDDLKNKSTNCY